MVKKITELSTLAIRLNEIHDYLTNRKIDFFKFSDQFKEHSRYLINDLTNLLEIDNPVLINSAINKLKGVQDKSEPPQIEVIITEDKSDSNLAAENADDSSENIKEDDVVNKEEYIRTFEKLILKPIKQIDNLLKQFANNEINYEDISRFTEIIKANAEASVNNGSDIISNMHRIMYEALMLIKTGELIPDKNVIEAMRSYEANVAAFNTVLDPPLVLRLITSFFPFKPISLSSVTTLQR